MEVTVVAGVAARGAAALASRPTGFTLALTLGPTALPLRTTLLAPAGAAVVTARSAAGGGATAAVTRRSRAALAAVTATASPLLLATNRLAARAAGGDGAAAGTARRAGLVDNRTRIGGADGSQQHENDIHGGIPP